MVFYNFGGFEMATSLLPIIQPSAAKKHIHPEEVTRDIGHKELEGINAVFVNMPLRETATPNVTPAGPLLMATNLRKNFGVKATIVDLNGYRIKDDDAQKRGLVNGRCLTEQEAIQLIDDHIIKHGEPDVVALSGMITTLRWQKRVAKHVKNKYPRTFLVSGGGLATELKTGLFRYITELDAVAHSEGDDVIKKICRDARIIREGGLKSALNSGKLEPYHLGAAQGKNRFLYAGDRVRNLDVLPHADLDIIETDVYGKPVLESYLRAPIWGQIASNSSAAPFTMKISTSSVSSRGCPFGCKYCYRGAQGEKKWGTRSAEHLYNELADYIQRYGIDFHGYVDDNFAVAMERIRDMVPIIGPLKIRWGTHTRLDEAAGVKPKPECPGEYIFEDPLRIELMAKAGCVYIGFGPESANKEVLEAIGKGGHTLTNGFVTKRVNGKNYQFPRSMSVGIENCIRFGIHSNCTWIMALPSENLQRLQETVAFIKWQE